uniref:Uncharacterized protein n=1 Tax=Knipowitschia caucasica TaxID=637954 RepID=A0AAV2LHR9_KNICA
MWNGEESPFKPKYEAEERFPVRNVRVDLPPLFAGDDSQSFLGWVRQLEVAIQATVGTGSDCDEELVRILPTRLCKSAFLLWDSLPDRVKHDYSAVKEKLAGAFGQRQFMDRFRATLSARPRGAGESLEVYAADVSRLVAEAFPDYGVVARREKFRRFLAGLDPALKSKCLEQGATDLEEALTIAERCENAREALQRDCVSNYPFNPHVAESRAVVQAVTSNDSLYKAVDQLSQEMHAMRMEMKSVYEENQRLRNSDMGQRQFVGRRSGFGGRCECTCGEPGCQGRPVSRVPSTTKQESQPRMACPSLGRILEAWCSFPAAEFSQGSRASGKLPVAGVMAQTPAFPREGPMFTDDVDVGLEKYPTAYVRGVIEGVEASVLVDSGASVSLISSDFRMAVPTLRGRPLKKDFIGSRAVNGQTLDTLGTVDVSLHLGRASWRHTFHVLRESTQAVLLGLDFLAVNRALLDLGRGVLEIGDTCLPLLYQAQLVPECCNVFLADGVIIPPLSEALVPVHVRPPGGANRPVTDFEGYLEPNVPDSAGLVVAHTVANVKNGVTVARVLNPSGKAVELKQGLHIGEFYPIHEVGAPSVVPTSHKSSVPCMVTDSPVNERQRAELQELLSRFSNVFSTPDGNTGKCSLIQHHIRTGDNPPIKQRAYRTSPEKRAEIERQVGQLLADGLVEESFSPWASPVVLVKKKGDALSRRPAEATAPAIDCVNVIDVGGANSHDQARESLPSSPVYSLCCDEARLRSLQQDDPDIRVVLGWLERGGVKRLEFAFGATRLHALEASERQKLYHDQTVCHRPYGVGALVWLNNPTESRTKLAPHWRGPYQVVQVFSSGGEPALTYDIINPLDTQKRSQVVHHDRLKPYTLPLPARSPASRVVASDPFLHGGEASLEPALAQPQQSRSGRLVKAPSHLKDFVV